MNDLAIWSFEGSQVRTTEINNEPWWVLTDVCKALEMDSHRAGEVTKRLDEDEYDSIVVTDSLGRTQNAYIVNEYGLYEVLIRSDKPKAKPFRKWVTHEVLPAIRKTGMYKISEVDSEDNNNELATPKAYAYLQIAKTISQCKTERLPLVISFLKEGGWSIPDQMEDVERVDTTVAGKMINDTLDDLGISLHELSILIDYPYMSLFEYARNGRSPRRKSFIKLKLALDKVKK